MVIPVNLRGVPVLFGFLIKFKLAVTCAVWVRGGRAQANQSESNQAHRRDANDSRLTRAKRYRESA